MSSSEIATVYYQTRSFVIITDYKYDISFTVRDGSAGLHLSSLQCCYLTSRTGFCWFWHMITPLLTGHFTPFPCTHTLCHVSLWTVLLPVLVTLMLCDLLLRQTVDIIYISYLFLYVIFLLHGILFVMPDPVLILFHCTFPIIIIIIIMFHTRSVHFPLLLVFYFVLFLLRSSWLLTRQINKK